MSNELQYYGTSEQSGLSVTAFVYDSSGQSISSALICSEPFNNSIFIANMPTAVAGVYGVRFFDSAENKTIGFCKINWDGTKEITEVNYDLIEQLIIDNSGGGLDQGEFI